MAAKTYTMKELACFAGVILPLIGGAGYVQGSGADKESGERIQRIESKLIAVDSSLNFKVSRIDSTVKIQHVLDSIDRTRDREKIDTVLASVRKVGSRLERYQMGALACNEVQIGKVAKRDK